MLSGHSDRARLRAIAIAAMRERGLEPEFGPEALSEVRALTGPPAGDGGPPRDLRSLLWCSIDNDDSRDLDQLSVAEAAAETAREVLVAIADVTRPCRGSAVDRHAGATRPRSTRRRASFRCCPSGSRPTRLR